MDYVLLQLWETADATLCYFCRSNIVTYNRSHVMQIPVTVMVLGASEHFDRMQYQGRIRYNVEEGFCIKSVEALGSNCHISQNVVLSMMRLKKFSRCASRSKVVLPD